jgi:hypothetical protein
MEKNMDRKKVAELGELVNKAMDKLGVRSSLVIVEGSYDETHSGVGIFARLNGSPYTLAQIAASVVQQIKADVKRYATPDQYQAFLELLMQMLSASMLKDMPGFAGVLNGLTGEVVDMESDIDERGAITMMRAAYGKDTVH